MSSLVRTGLGRALLLMSLGLPAVGVAGKPTPPAQRTAGSPEATSGHALARKAFDAWATGERTGDYSAFLALLGPSFQLFSHPLFPRVYRGPEALETMRGLIAQRQATPNNLTFSNVEVSANDGTVVFQFDSKGTVQGGAFPYAGWNIIVFTVDGGRLTGFREYLGFVNPAWFKER
jgi:hypothetical protein